MNAQLHKELVRFKRPFLAVLLVMLFMLLASQPFAQAGDPWGWVPTGPVVQPRESHTATLLLDGQVLVAGGYTRDESGVIGIRYLSSAERFNPGTDTWTLTANELTIPGINHSATLLNDGRVLVAGGEIYRFYEPETHSDCSLYDPSTDTWSDTGSMIGNFDPDPDWGGEKGRAGHTATLLPDGRVLAAGGYFVFDPFSIDTETTSNTAELFDPATETWTQTADMNVARHGHTATLLQNGQVLVTGGERFPFWVEDFEDTAELYDPTTDTWNPTDPMTVARANHTATLLQDGRVLVAGGRSQDEWVGIFHQSTEIYDPVTGTWTQAADMNIARADHTATLLQDGRVLVKGGDRYLDETTWDYVYPKSAEIFDPAIDTWTEAPNMIFGGETATLLQNGWVLVRGDTTAEVYRPASEQDLEYAALVALYHSTDGDNWTHNDNWLSTTVPHCQWFGISCNPQGYVIHIQLSGNQLSGSLPSELGNLSYLTDLALSWNQLLGSIPPELGQLSTLTSFDLSNNQLSGSIPPELGNLDNLTNLNLISNQLSGPIPLELTNLNGLEYLNLSWNQLSGPIPPELSRLNRLKDLILAVNQLSGVIPPELGYLSKLTYLDLGANQLNGSIPTELGNLSLLEDLRLYGNQLNGPIPTELGNLSQLNFVELYGNQLEGPIPHELSFLSGVGWLRLHDNQLLCWDTQGVLNWAINIRDNLSNASWDYPNPGEVVCPCQTMPGNIVSNPCFEDGKSPWSFYTNGWAGFNVSGPAFGGAYAARVQIDKEGSNVQLYQAYLALEPNQAYRLYFAAKSNSGHDVSLYLHKHGYPYTNYGLYGKEFDLTPQWKQYQWDFTTNSQAAADGRLRFWLAPYDAAGDEYWFDNVYLLKVTDGVPEPPDPNPQDPPVPPYGHCSPPVDGNVIGNPGFEASTISPWSFYTNGSAGRLLSSDSYECSQAFEAAIYQAGSNVQLYQAGLYLQPNTPYQLRLAAKSTDGRDVRLYLHKHRSPYTNYGLNGLTLDLTEEWQVFVVQFTTTGFTSPVWDGRLRIWLAESDAPGAHYFFDDVVLTTLDDGASSSLMALDRLDSANSAMSTGLKLTTAASSATGKLLSSGFFIDDDDAGRAKGAFIPGGQRGAPTCDQAQPSHAKLWPANGKLVKVKIVGAGKPQDITINGIWQDEDIGAEADARIDGQEAWLRAERNEGGNGRVYHVAFSASYRGGGSCEHEVLVTVPPAKGVKSIDDGPLADATKP